MRHISREDELDGDATADPFRQRLSPASFFRGKLKDSFGAGRMVEESPPIRDRILLRRGREFVHEAFGHEDVVRRPNAAPEGGRDARRFHLQILDMKIWERIDQIDRTICGVGVETILESRGEPSRKDRGAREAMVPGDRHSFLIESGR